MDSLRAAANDARSDLPVLRAAMAGELAQTDEHRAARDSLPARHAELWGMLESCALAHPRERVQDQRS